MRNDDHTPASFTYQNFEVRDFVSSHFSTNESSPLGRIRSNLIKVLNKHNTLPKLIVVVLDDDTTKITKHLTEPSVTATQIVHWFLREFHKSIDIYKDWLPIKAKTANLPHILWITPPTLKLFSAHDNARRENFTKILQSTAAKYPEMSCLNLLKIWDGQDSSLFVRDAYRFTAQGLCDYWASVDSAIRYCFTAIISKIEKKSSLSAQKPRNHCHNYNRYHWPSSLSHQNRQKLPTPQPSTR